MGATRRDGVEAGGVGQCLGQIRRMVLTGELLPGEKLVQADLAQRLGLSRIPVREALAGLTAEGLVLYRPNTGYTVMRPSVDDLSQIYLMRHLLEDELVRSIALEDVDADAMEQRNDELATLKPPDDLDAYRAANQAFHFALFDCSPLRLVRQEVQRMWTLSEFYRSRYMYEAGAAERVVADHVQMIVAVRARDMPRLIELGDAHRDQTESSLARALGRVRSAAPRPPRSSS